MNTWQIQEAKSRFSELVEQTLRSGAQLVTRHGRKMIAVIPYEEYLKLTGKTGNLADFLLTSPLAGTDLNLERDRSLPPALDLEE